MRPELPFLATGALTVAGGAIREKAFPKDGTKAVVGTVVLVIAASATADTRVAPLVHAIGLLLMLASLMAVVRSVQSKKKV